LDSFSGNAGAPDSFPLEHAPNSATGANRQQPAISALRSTVLRDGISFRALQVSSGAVSLIFLLMAIY